MRALITGIAGFFGNHLSERLLSLEWDVYGLDLRTPAIPHLQNKTYITSLDNKDHLHAILAEVKPDIVFHLAGIIKANHAQSYIEANVLGTLSLFEALLETGIKPRVILASSSAVYGAGQGKRLISEKFPLRPITDYAVSKVAQEAIGQRFWFGNGIPVIIARTFNTLGPGQPETLACSAFARQIAFAENNEQIHSIQIGNLNTHRDFVDIRDVTNALALLSIQGKPGEAYNICSGKTVSIQECLNELLKLSRKPLQVSKDPTKLQKNDVPIQIGTPAKLKQATRWDPQFSTKQSLADMLNDWRKRIAASTNSN